MNSTGIQSAAIVLLGLGFATGPDILLTPDPEVHTRKAAQRMVQASRTHLAPVYAPLAEELVSRLGLAEKEGIGIDLGAGPGSLTLELSRRSPRMYWINADINPHFFPFFFEAAESAGVGHRVGAVFADAQALPFRDDYADILVSRGSFQFWKDRRLGFQEIYRVLKPGGTAVVGRGFSENLPPRVARKIRAGQKKGFPRYDVTETRAELESIMKSMGLASYGIRTPRPPGSEGINYGIWLEFRKPPNPSSGATKPAG